MHKKELWAVFIVIALFSGVLVYTAARAVGQILTLQDSNFDIASLASTTGWQAYSNPDFKFSLHYPPDWQISTAGLTANVPYIAIGNPLEGTSTYALNIFVESNPDGLSSLEYVHNLLADARKQDAMNPSSSSAPMLTPQFSRSLVTTVGNYPGYELLDVFEFDRSAERIYVGHGPLMLRFDFPIARENRNLSLPVRNNAIVHEILGTLNF